MRLFIFVVILVFSGCTSNVVQNLPGEKVHGDASVKEEKTVPEVREINVGDAKSSDEPVGGEPVPAPDVVVPPDMTKGPDNARPEEPVSSDSAGPVDMGPPKRLPRVGIDALEYMGAFRVDSTKQGDSNFDYSNNAMAYHEKNDSLFVVGHVYQQAIAELAIPKIVKSTKLADVAVAKTFLQPFANVHNKFTPGVPLNYFSIKGLYVLGDRVLAHYLNWYDAGGTLKKTTFVVEDKTNLKTTKITGAYEMTGQNHSGGWISEIPTAWQSSLGGTHISGASNFASIISRLCVGVSAYVFTPSKDLAGKDPKAGKVPAKALLDFDLKHPLYDVSVFGPGKTGSDEILYNKNKNNKLFTINSRAVYGFIVPGTRTYMSIGSSAGHEHGLGYKITQDDGNLCGGPCPYVAKDKYNFYWLWDVEDLVKVKNGLLKPYEVRPYAYGKFATPFSTLNPINAGTYDKKNRRLFLALEKADKVGYSVRPIFLIYKVNVK